MSNPQSLVRAQLSCLQEVAQLAEHESKNVFRNLVALIFTAFVAQR